MFFIFASCNVLGKKGGRMDSKMHWSVELGAELPVLLDTEEFFAEAELDIIFPRSSACDIMDSQITKAFVAKTVCPNKKNKVTFSADIFIKGRSELVSKSIHTRAKYFLSLPNNIPVSCELIRCECVDSR